MAAGGTPALPGARAGYVRWISGLGGLLLLFLGLVPSPALAALRGTVVRVTDGDTVVVRSGGSDTRVRLLGIDAPEHDQEPWGPRASAFLAKLVDGKVVRVETDVQPRDRYRRMLGYVFASGLFVNRELVRQGYAMLYTFPPNVAHTAELVAAQREARAAGRNIWAPDGGLGITPYEWRNGKPAPRSIGQEGLPTGRGSTAGDSPAAAEGQVAAPAEGNIVAPSEALSPIVGNAKSRKFHGATCPLARRIAARNRVEFSSARAAEAAGMTACGVCKGR